MQGDYVAGGAKALEAFVSAAAIAAGVSFGMILTGGDVMIIQVIAAFAAIFTFAMALEIPKNIL